jgi:hypothetical protein
MDTKIIDIAFSEWMETPGFSEDEKLFASNNKTETYRAAAFYSGFIAGCKYTDSRSKY